MEEYVFGHIKRNGLMIDNLKIISDNPTNYFGAISIERKYDDNYITDTFCVKEKYNSIEQDGKFYDFYIIDNHYRYTDKFSPQRPGAEQNITDLEIQNIEQDQYITDLEIENIQLSNRVTALEEAVEKIKEVIENV